MEYPNQCKELQRRISATDCGWDFPLPFTYQRFEGVTHLSSPRHYQAPLFGSDASFKQATPRGVQHNTSEPDDFVYTLPLGQGCELIKTICLAIVALGNGGTSQVSQQDTNLCWAKYKCWMPLPAGEWVARVSYSSLFYGQDSEPRPWLTLSVSFASSPGIFNLQEV